MKTVNNTTQKPLSIPLPRGKKLHLGPGKTGQISSKDAEHPPLKKLIETGEVEILDDGPAQNAAASAGRKAQGFLLGHNASSGGRRSGDR